MTDKFKDDIRTECIKSVYENGVEYTIGNLNKHLALELATNGEDLELITFLVNEMQMVANSVRFYA